MGGDRLFWVRQSRTVFAAGLLWLMPAAAYAAETKIVIGVISPTDVGGAGLQRAIGAAHAATIKFAFSRLGNTITVGSSQIPLDIRFVSDHGNPKEAVEAAKLLVADGAVAILGPVDSGSTRAVLEAGLRVPVLSALSTARSLSDPRNEWFFRLTRNDRDRVAEYLDALTRESKLTRPRIVIYDSGSSYASELKQEIVNQLDGKIDGEIKWSELLGSNLLSAEGQERVRRGEGFFDGAVEKLRPAPATIFVLGTSANAALIASGIDAYLKAREKLSLAPQFLFVGHDDDLRAGAPQGSITIGDPEIVDWNQSSAAALRADLQSYRNDRRLDLVVTAYEAAFYVLPRALQLAASGAQGIPPPETLREKLREVLETESFESIEPWRPITLRNGEMEGVPPLPVYRIESEFHLVDVDDHAAYLEVAAPQEVGWLQGGVTINAKRHGGRFGKDPTIERVDVDPAEWVSAAYSERGEDMDISFYPLRPGTYRLQSAMPTDPLNPTVKVSLGGAYPLALLGGLIGSMVAVFGRAHRGWRSWSLRVLLGTLTGGVLMALQLHQGSLPAVIPVPSVGNSPLAAAFWAGVTGGLAGPGLLVILVSRLPGYSSSAGDSGSQKGDSSDEVRTGKSSVA